mgnify:FL=1|tara:strand:- start:557 stop:1204 length:648 start_codon:yes stop_codon:yes gene_type:complete
MKIYKFTNGDTYTPFAAAWEYFICEDKLTIPLDDIKKEILDKEKSIIDQHEFEDDWGTKLGANSLTARSNKYNLLKFDSADPLRRCIKKTHDKFVMEIGFKYAPQIYVQCWANVMRKGDQIAVHSHGTDPYGYLSGHVCVQVNDTNTNYYNPYGGSAWDSPNEVGKITLFPNYLPHGTDKVEDDDERITIAFDIYTEEGYTNSITDDMKSHWLKL